MGRVFGAVGGPAVTACLALPGRSGRLVWLEQREHGGGGGGGGDAGLEVTLEGLWLVLLSPLGSPGKFLGAEMTCSELQVKRSNPVAGLT